MPTQASVQGAEGNARPVIVTAPSTAPVSVVGNAASPVPVTAPSTAPVSVVGNASAPVPVTAPTSSPVAVIGDSANPVPVLVDPTTPVSVTVTNPGNSVAGVNVVSTGLVPAAGATSTVALDLGTGFGEYRTAIMLFSGLADASNVLTLTGSTDNTTFYPLVSMGGAPAVDETGNAIASVTAYVAGNRYINGVLTNGTTAQTAATLTLAAQ